MAAVFIPLVALFVAATLIGERNRDAWRVWPKAVASGGFVAVAVDAGAWDTGYGRWVLVALALGWIGDVALSIDRAPLFVVGLAVFLGSHVAYVGGFGVLGIRAIAATVTLAVLMIPAVAVGRWLMPHVPRALTAPVIAYIAVITAMVAAAAGAASGGAPWPTLPAAVLFYLSDLFVARDRFVATGFENRIIGLPMYYTAQVLFALSVGML